MAERYLVSNNGASRYSGHQDQRVYKTRVEAQKRIKKIKALTGKNYQITKIDWTD